jgi:hypothetical protein
MAGIGANDNFLSLYRNSTSSSLFSHPKRTEKLKKIKFGTKMLFSKIKGINI